MSTSISLHRDHAYQTVLGACLFNIVCARTSSARDAFRSLLHSTHTSTRGHDTRLYGATLSYLIISLKNEQCAGRIYVFLALKPILHQSARRPRLWNCTALAFLPLLIFRAKERALRGTHLGLSCTELAILSVYTEATLPNCKEAILFNNMGYGYCTTLTLISNIFDLDHSCME